MSRRLETRVDALSRRVLELEVEVAWLRGAVEVERPLPRLGSPAPRPTPTRRPSGSVGWQRVPATEPEPPSPRPVPAAPTRPPREIDFGELLGARALAIAGGVVTLLGILFFFVLAVERGWVGPGARVSCGALASILVLLAGFELRRRYGESDSSLAAVGAGIAGGFGTLLAAAALYSLIPDYAALIVAAVIATIATAIAVAWRAQLVAGLGLVGAALVPIVEATQGGLSTIGTAFAALVFAGTTVVAARCRWRRLLVACTLATAPQIVALVGNEGSTAARAVLAAAFWLLYAGAGIAWHLKFEAPRLRIFSRSMLVLGAWLAACSAFALFGSPAQGWAALAVAAAFGLAAAAFFTRRQTRDLSAFLGAVGLTVGALALADLLSGQPLAYAWAAEAAVLAWLAWRLREPRYQLWSLGYLWLTLAHVLAFDAPLSSLFSRTEHPARGAGTVVALALATAIFAFYARSRKRRKIVGALARLFRALAGGQPVLRASALWASGVLAAYVFALVVLEIAVAIGGTDTGFDWGHVAIGASWAAVGLCILLTGSRIGGLVWVGLVALEVAVFDPRALAPTAWATAFLIVAGLALTAALAEELRRPPSGSPWSWPAVGFVAVSVGLSVVAVVELAPDGDIQGAGLLGLACVYAALAARIFRLPERDFTTLLWGIALVLGAVAVTQILAGTYLVLAWTAAAAGLAGLGVRVGEPRLEIGAAAYAALAFGHAIVLEAPPSDFFSAQSHPASGVPALILVALATAVLARSLSASTEVARRARPAAWWTAGLVGLYAVSLSVLELFERVSPSDVQTNFQRGHTAVSAVWGLLGLVLLYLGLTRLLALRLAGFVLFGLGLAKIFLYDLRELSSVTRALSFLAVGAVLLLGGFFYQRLSARARGDGGVAA